MRAISEPKADELKKDVSSPGGLPDLSVTELLAALEKKIKDFARSAGLHDLKTANEAESDTETFLRIRSPYCYELWLFLRSDPFFTDNQTPISVLFQNILRDIENFSSDTSVDEVMKFLRLMKKRGCAIIAFVDFAEFADVKQVTRALSDLADAAVARAFSHAVFAEIKSGKSPLTEADFRNNRTGFMVTAMGKHGGRELNFSSDTDLCVFFDAEVVPAEQREDLFRSWLHAVKIAVKILSERTAQGYVYRTDLRLRPDPGSTKQAVSLAFAERYYERSGQNWERAAFIKARIIYGDPQAEVIFRDFLRPFIWRKSLDYSAIRDIHSIKRQIHQRYGHDEIKAAGHDVKLGRGGIREIELFAQTQQLIGGGKDTRLRAPATVDALAALTQTERLSEERRAKLTEAYYFLRFVEHRLQMLRDEQTHTVPKDPERFRLFCEFCFYPNAESFSKALTDILENVRLCYDDLFSEHQALGGESGRLVFTGTDNDPETVKNIEQYGFTRANEICELIRAWHRGEYKSMRTAKARELLTEFTPFLLKSLSETADPDAAFFRFDVFLSGLPYGVGIFSMFLNRPFIFDLLIEIISASPEIADYMARRPGLIEALISPDFFHPLGDAKALMAEMRYLPSHSERPEILMNSVRRYVHEQRFRTAVLLLKDFITPEKAGQAFSDLARASVRILSEAAEAEMRARYGFPTLAESPCGMCVIGAGSLGGGEMTADSDLDLIFVYDPEPFVIQSDLIDAQSYYAKLAGKILTFLTVRTAEGGLYPADTRLRPSGRSGPLAVRLESFTDYYKFHAWTWEKAALTRAEPLSGSEELLSAVKSAIARAIKEAVTEPEHAEKIAADLSDMRDKLSAERKAISIWDVKLQEGGRFDIAFIMQFLTLSYAGKLNLTLETSSEKTLRKLFDAEVLSFEEYALLSGANTTLTALNQLFSLLMTDIHNIENSGGKIKRKILKVIDTDSLMAAELSLRDIYEGVKKIFDRRLRQAFPKPEN